MNYSMSSNLSATVIDLEDDHTLATDGRGGSKKDSPTRSQVNLTGGFVAVTGELLHVDTIYREVSLLLIPSCLACSARLFRRLNKIDVIYEHHMAGEEIGIGEWVPGCCCNLKMGPLSLSHRRRP